MSSFIAHIPFAIWENLLLMGILFFAYRLIERYTAYKASVKYSIAVLMQIMGCFHFIITLVYKPFEYQIANLLTNTISFPFEVYYTYFGVVYILVFCFYLFQFIYQIEQVNILTKSANFLQHTQWMDLLKECKITTPENLKIGTSTTIHTPIVFGILEPIILLPVSICTQLNTDQIKLLLIHELAHISRFDYLVNIILKGIQSLLWFNPFVYSLQKQIQLQREMACDAMVIANTHAPIDYAKALFQLAQNASALRPSLSLGATSNEADLLLRIQQMNKLPVQYPKSKSKLMGLFLLIFVTPYIVKSSLQYSTSPQLVIKHANHIVTTHTLTSQLSIVNKHTKALPSIKSKMPIKEINDPIIAKLHYNDLLHETQDWVKSLESPLHLADYDENTSIRDSLENRYIDRLLMSSIVKNYKLKRAILEQVLSKASNPNEAKDYLMNSKEWAEILQYEQWAHEYLQKQ